MHFKPVRTHSKPVRTHSKPVRTHFKPIRTHFEPIRTILASNASLTQPEQFFQSLDNGATWNTIPSPLGRPALQKRQGKFYAVKGPSLYTSSDAGLNWQTVYTFPYSMDAAKFYIVRDTILLAYPSGKLLFYSSDGGQSFDTLPSPPRASNSPFVLRVYNDELLLMRRELLYFSKDMGQHWQQMEPPAGIPPSVIISGENSAYGDNTFFTLDNRKIRLDELRQVTGKVFLDINGNGIEDDNENGLNNLVVKASQSSLLSNTYADGKFSLLLDSDAHDLSVDQVPTHYSVFPQQITIPGGASTIAPVSFAVQPQEFVNDASIRLLSAAAFRAGYANTLHLSVNNPGTLPCSGQVKLSLPAVLSVLNVTPAADLTSGDTLIWSYNNLLPLTEWKIRLDINTAVVPPETPVSLWAAVETQADVDLANNFVFINEGVVSSFDPNDKAVSKTEIPVESADNEELTYTIRFQNLGNIETDFITVRDTLSEALDAATVRILTASHLYEWTIEEGRILVFRFNPIRLTPASEDSLRSQGFIQFAVRLKPGLQPGDEIANTAHIYFDFNPAVVTNTVVSSIQVVSTFEPSKRGIPLEIFPNPANTMATIRIPVEMKDKGVLDIFSISGSRLYSISIASNPATVDTQHLPAGAYWCLYKSGSQTVWGKLLIQR